MAEPEYVAIEKIEIKEGSGMVAYVPGEYVSAEAVANLGAQDKVRPVQPERSAQRGTQADTPAPSE